jgi:hypothetical protein
LTQQVTFGTLLWRRAQQKNEFGGAGASMITAKNRSLADVERRLGALVSATAARLREGGPKRAAVVAVIRRFLDEGQEIIYRSLLWIYFQNALYEAGYGAWARDRRLRIYSTVSHEVIGGGEHLPEDWQWFEKDKRRKAGPGAAPDRGGNKAARGSSSPRRRGR